MAYSTGSGLSGPRAVEDPKPLVRFVPDRIYERGGKQVLRGALSFVPDPDCPSALSQWPTWVSGELQKGVRLYLADIKNATVPAWMGASDPPLIAKALQDPDPAPATRLWQALFAPLRPAMASAGVQLAFSASHLETQPLLETLQAISSRPWDALGRAISDGLAGKRERPLAIDTPAAGTTPAHYGPLHIIAAPAQELDGVLSMFRAMRHLSALPIRARGLASLGPATEHWSGLSDLFSGSLAAPVLEPLVANGATRDDAALNAIGRRGKLAGLQAAIDQEVKKQSARTSASGAGQSVFDRTPPSPRPEMRLTALLRNKIRAVRTADFLAARAAYKNRVASKGVAGLTAPPGARVQAPVAFAKWITQSAQSLIGALPINFDVQQSVPLQDVFVRHMLSLRPDPIVTYDGSAYWPDGALAAAAELNAVLTSFSDTMSRRLFGIQAYPALARAVKLVVDVEVEIPDSAISRVGPPSATAWFMVGAATGATGTPIAWTACKRRDTLFMPVTEQEVARATVPGTPVVDYSTYEGVLNLAAANGNAPRFTVTSVDVVGGAEQLVQDGQAAANDRRTGAALTESGQPPERGIGLAILDGLRAEAAQAQAADSQAQADALAQQKPVIFYTDQLTLGYRLDVAVDSRKTGQRTWRALGRRKIRFGHLKDDKGRFAVEPIVEAALKACAPRIEGKVDWERFRDDLDDVSHKPAARVVAEQQVEAGNAGDVAQAITQQIIAQWDGSPTGAATARAASATKIKTQVDIQQDLPLSVTFSLPTAQDEPNRPPQLEIGRPFRFGMRNAYLGGAGHNVETAGEIYSGDAGPLILPQSDSDAMFRRPERIAAPVLARLHNHGSEPGRLPGDNVGDVIVRSGDLLECQTEFARRIVYAPGLPMAFAIQHPKGNGLGRILDGEHTLGGRPIGGFLNVALDPVTGGLPVLHNGEVAPAKPVDITKKPVIPLNERPAEGIYKVEGTDEKDIASRQAHYYPDPAVDRLIFELWTRGPNARQIDGAHVEVEIYDPIYRQAADQAIFGTDNGVACIYPHAMPVVVEVLRGPTRQLLHDPRRDTGAISDSGDFRILQPYQTPDDDTVTARRVRIVLPPGEDVDVRAWTWTAPKKLEWFRTFDGVTKLLGLLSGTAALATQSEQIAKGAELVFGPKAKVTDANSLAEVRLQIAGVMAKLHATTPAPDQSEILTFRAVHAAQRPAAPVWLCGAWGETPNICPVPNPPSAENSEQFRLFVLRATVADRDWPQWLTDNPTCPDQWENVHQLGAATTWLGGDLAFDLKRANKLAFRTCYRDVRDIPGKPILLKDGVPQFPTLGPSIVSVALDDDPYAPSAPHVGDLRQLDVLRSLNGRPRGLVLHLPDARAYRLEITPSASSRFVRMLRTEANASDEEEYFTTSGATQTLWVPATVRPAPMAHVDLLPVFVWSEVQENGGRVMTRITRMRIAWKRPGVTNPNNVRSKISTCSWYSSGEGERLGIVFMPQGQEIGPQTPPLGAVEPYISRWAADPIRTAFSKPGWTLPDTFLQKNLEMISEPGQQMPFPGDPDGTDSAPKMQRVDLQTFAPQYDAAQDTWYVDIAIDSGAVAGPWIQLGLVRFQKHAISRGAHDLRVSMPASVGFRLEPVRRISVKSLAQRADDKLWPVEIIVSGPLSFVNGGADAQPSQGLRDILAELTRPRFKLKILREPFLSSLSNAGEVIVAEANSDNAPPPSGNELWRTTIYLDRSPTEQRHHVFIEEVDPMMSAHATVGTAETLVESGPRFMAKVRIHRPQ